VTRYLIVEAEGWDPDHKIIEAESPEAALKAWDASDPYFYPQSAAIVAEIKLEVAGGRKAPPS